MRLQDIKTANAIIMDKCGSWYNLNRKLIEEDIPEARIFWLEPVELLNYHQQSQLWEEYICETQ